MERYYVDMQAKLNGKWAEIKAEREIWEQEKKEISDLVKLDSEVVSLNIGGKNHIQTEKDILRSDGESKLAKMFSDMHELKMVGEEVFIDRDGATFETLINYLRNERRVFPDFAEKNEENMFIKELYFWGIDSHNAGKQEAYLKKLDTMSTKFEGARETPSKTPFKVEKYVPTEIPQPRVDSRRSK